MGILKGGVSTTESIVDETVTGSINGINTVFTTSDLYIAGSLTIFLNGLQQAKPGDYSETTSSSFTFINAPIGGANPDIITARYVKLS